MRNETCFTVFIVLCIFWCVCVCVCVSVHVCVCVREFNSLKSVSRISRRDRERETDRVLRRGRVDELTVGGSRRTQSQKREREREREREERGSERECSRAHRR